MTVIELRKVARENGVTLSAGISKQGIVERLCDALVEKPAPAPAPEPSAEEKLLTEIRDLLKEKK